MKKHTLLLLLLCIQAASVSAQRIDSTWFAPRAFIGKQTPAICGKTLTGKEINEDYFKGKVSVLVFSNLINVGSLRQIYFLNGLNRDFKNRSFRMLSIMPNAKQDVVDFNSDPPNTGEGAALRANFKLPLMEYDVMATCEGRNPDDLPGIRKACDSVVSDFLIGGYPTILLVDKKGIVRYIHVSMVPSEEGPAWTDVLRQQIEGLLLEEQP